MSALSSDSDFFFLIEAGGKSIGKLIGFSSDREVFAAKIKMGKYDASIAMTADLFSERGDGLGSFSTRFAFSKHPERESSYTHPDWERDKAIHFLAVDTSGKVIWLFNTNDENVQVAGGVILRDGSPWVWYRRPNAQSCVLGSFVFARLENRVFQATCEENIKYQP